MNQYYNPVRTIQGAGCVEEIGALLRSQVPEGVQVLDVYKRQAAPCAAEPCI